MSAERLVGSGWAHAPTLPDKLSSLLDEVMKLSHVDASGRTVVTDALTLEKHMNTFRSSVR